MIKSRVDYELKLIGLQRKNLHLRIEFEHNETKEEIKVTGGG